MTNTKSRYLKIILPVLTSAALVLFAALNVNASIDSKSASEFSQYCAQNSTVCSKVDFSEATSGLVSCPNENQVVKDVYAHAGDGQTIYKLPQGGFDYVVNGNSALVTLNGHPHAISWIAVVCDTVASPTPVVTPTPTPTVKPTPSATPTPTPLVTPTPTPVVTPTPTPSATPQPKLGSIEVCKIIVGEDGKVTNGSGVPGVTFTINGLEPVLNSGEGPGGVLPNTTFVTPLALNADLLGTDNINDALCVKYNNLTVGDYFYGQETISASSGWATPQYNDQFNVTVKGVGDFFLYDGGVFKHGYSDNKNADGHIILQDERPNRRLIILNTVKPSATPTPTPTPSVGGSTNTNNNSNNQEQSQTQNNNQTVTVNVNQGSVLGSSVPTKQPETGVSVLGLASLFSAAPFGLMLSRFGKGRLTSKKKEDLGSFALSAFEDRESNKGLDNL